MSNPWPAVPPPPEQPPRVTAVPDLPGAVRRTREELERLRDDALRQRDAGEQARVSVYANFRKEAALAEGVWAAARWLLGERPTSPISNEPNEYPFVPRVVGRERTRALDCLERNAWTDIDEDYAAGVWHTIGWAFQRSDTPRPVPES
jgi:hypothetical protein